MDRSKKLDSLKGQVFKVIYLKEDNNSTLNIYLDSLYIQLKGIEADDDCLQNNLKFNSIVNTIAYLKTNDFTFDQCKREIFKCMNYLKELANEL